MAAIHALTSCELLHSVFDNHRSCTFVGKNLCEYRISFCAAHYVCGANAATEQNDQVFEFWDHAAGRPAGIDQMPCVSDSDPRKLCILVTLVKVDTIYIG